MKKWICQCFLQTPCNEQSLLVRDSFQAHLTDEVKVDLNQRKIDVAVIPGGLTPVLQPLDKVLEPSCSKIMSEESTGMDDQQPTRL